MTVPKLKCSLGVPSHAVAPDVLVQRLSQLSYVLETCELISMQRKVTPEYEQAVVSVYAVQLQVERSHIALQQFVRLTTQQREYLQQLCEQWCEQDVNGLKFTPITSTSLVHSALLGSVNLSLALPHPALFLGRDMSNALPRIEAAKPLRQLLNVSQMHLHNAPWVTQGLVSPTHSIQDSTSKDELTFNAVKQVCNSLWLGPAIESTPLLNTYLHNGLAVWWDELDSLDHATSSQLKSIMSNQSNKQAIKIQFEFVDVSFECVVRRRASWAFWRAPLRMFDLFKEIS